MKDVSNSAHHISLGLHNMNFIRSEKIIHKHKTAGKISIHLNKYIY